jgi:hypothetical protein
LLVVKGEIAGCSGFSDIGCSLCAHIRVSNIEGLFQKEMDFGHHLVMVYGNYVEEIKGLSKLMGFEVVEA